MALTAPMFVGALRKANPEITEQDGKMIWDNMSKGMDMSMLTEDDALRMAYQLAGATRNADANAAKVGAALESLGGPVNAPKSVPAPAPVVEPQQLQTVEITGKRLPKSTDTPPREMKDEFYVPALNIPRQPDDEIEGNRKLLLQNQANTLAMGQQNTPDAIRDAYARYADMLEQNARRRAGAVSMASGSEQAYKSNDTFWDQQNKAAEARTTAPMKSILDQYKQGVADNSTLISSLKTQRQFAIDSSMAGLDQMKKAAELQAIVNNGNMAKQYADSTSEISDDYRDLAASTLFKLGYSKEQVNKMVGGKSALYLNMLMSGIVPDMTRRVEEYQKLREATQKADTGEAVTNAMVAGRQGERGMQLTEDAKKRLPYSTLMGGGQALAPNQSLLKEKEAATGRKITDEEKIENFKLVTKPDIDQARALLRAGGYSGKGTVIFSSVVPDTDQQVFMSILANINATAPELLPAGMSEEIKRAQQGTGFTGKMLPSMTTEALEALMRRHELYMARLISSRNQRSADDTGTPYSPDKRTRDLPKTNAKGWRLATDKNGNKAYVNPRNPNEYEEVQ